MYLCLAFDCQSLAKYSAAAAALAYSSVCLNQQRGFILKHQLAVRSCAAVGIIRTDVAVFDFIANASGGFR